MGAARRPVSVSVAVPSSPAAVRVPVRMSTRPSSRAIGLWRQPSAGKRSRSSIVKSPVGAQVPAISSGCGHRRLTSLSTRPATMPSPRKSRSMVRSLLARPKLPAVKLTAPRKRPDSGKASSSSDHATAPPLVMIWIGRTRSAGPSAVRSTSATSSTSSAGPSTAIAVSTFSAGLLAARRYTSGAAPSLRRMVRAWVSPDARTVNRSASTGMPASWAGAMSSSCAAQRPCGSQTSPPSQSASRVQPRMQIRSAQKLAALQSAST
jgi:hypothetical protein